MGDGLAWTELLKHAEVAGIAPSSSVRGTQQADGTMVEVTRTVAKVSSMAGMTPTTGGGSQLRE